MMKPKNLRSLAFILATGTLSIALFTSSVARADDEPSFHCVAKTLAIYSPGPKWGQLEQMLDQHLVFIAEQLKTQAMDSAGPMISETGEPSGGMSIYSLTDAAKVRALVESDPLIRNHVATYELRNWRMCQ